MATLLYEWMTPQQAAEALEVFLAERAPARERLRTGLAGHGLDLDRMLDGTPESVAALWDWITERVAGLGTDPHSLTEDPTVPEWPSWARHGLLVDPHPPAESLALVDGFASCLAEVITAAVPEARWQVGRHRISDYPMRNRPVLAADHHEIFLPALPLYSAYQSAHGRDPMSGSEMAAHVQRTVRALRGEGVEAATAADPLVTVVAEVDCFDVGLRQDIADEHADVVDRLIEELADRDGVASVHRYGPAALVVDAPSWEELRLQMWLTLWLQRNLPR